MGWRQPGTYKCKFCGEKIRSKKMMKEHLFATHEDMLYYIITDKPHILHEVSKILVMEVGEPYEEEKPTEPK